MVRPNSKTVAFVHRRRWKWRDETIRTYIGIDVGSITTKIAAIDEDARVLASLYTRNQGNPIRSAQDGVRKIAAQLPRDISIDGIGCTGSARRLLGVVTGANIIKNEIIAHAVAACYFIPDVKTVIEIGGQDSKIILIRDAVAIDFAMNTVCAAGTGSFLDHQAGRLGLSIEEFSTLSLKSSSKVNIAGRCTVFAESDMIHKAQLGASREDIINGLCEAIVRNYLSNVGRGKEIKAPVAFLGGVAANKGVKRAFEAALETEVIVPDYHNIMGALGAALLAKDEASGNAVNVSGFEFADIDFASRSFSCDGCPNSCEVMETLKGESIIDRYGDRCGKWQTV